MSDSAKRPGDQAILEELVKRGDDLSAPRHTLVFFYRAKDDTRSAEAVLNPLAQRLQAIGWGVVDLREDALIAETQRPADAASVDSMVDQMEALAREFGVKFDGWECAILGAKP